MFEFSLLKSLFFELDKYKMDGATEEKEGMSTFRTINIHYASVPEITSITAEERILPMVDRYYIYVNGEDRPTELRDEKVSQAVYEFYKDHFPSYLKEGLPDILGELNILECFQVYNMPDYRPKHAFPGLIKLEDIRNGNVKLDERFATFPGIARVKPGEMGKPSIADYKGYQAFDEDEEKAREQVNDRLEEMKKSFASELASFDIPDIEEIKAQAAKMAEEEKRG